MKRAFRGSGTRILVVSLMLGSLGAIEGSSLPGFNLHAEHVETSGIVFRDITKSAGIDFVHDNARTEDK